MEILFLNILIIALISFCIAFYFLVYKPISDVRKDIQSIVLLKSHIDMVISRTNTLTVVVQKLKDRLPDFACGHWATIEADGNKLIGKRFALF